MGLIRDTYRLAPVIIYPAGWCAIKSLHKWRGLDERDKMKIVHFGYKFVYIRRPIYQGTHNLGLRVFKFVPSSRKVDDQR